MSNVLRPALLFRVTCLAFLASCPLLFAEVPVKINYVGRLDAVPGGTGAAAPTTEQVMYMVFRLYDEPGNGLDADKNAALWGRQAPVALEDGVFDVDLEDGLGTKVSGARYDTLAEAIGAALARGSSTLYIGITPEKDTHAEIFPRQRVTAVTKAVQAAYVRSVPDSFSIAHGTLRADALVVTGAATLSGANYAAAVVDAKANVGFQGEIKVDGTLTARDLSLSGRLATDALAVETLNPGAAVAVDGAITVASNATLRGSLGSQALTAAVAVVTAPAGQIALDKVGPAQRLVLNDFVNQSGNGFDSVASVGWNVLGGWEGLSESEVLNLQNVNAQIAVTCWDEASSQMKTRMSVTEGLWEAACDCIAYFQVRIYNRSPSYGACVQFYLVDSKDENNFINRTPCAVSSLRNGNGASLDSVVPMILRKGQLVKWIGVNADKNETADLYEMKDSYVKGITYRKFNWEND